MKANPWSVVQAHHRTLVDDRSGRPHWPDYAVFYGLPIGVFAGSWALGLTLPEGASQGLLTVAGLLSAFFFGVMLQVSERALQWADEKPAQGPSTTWQADFLTQIAANAGYASLVSIATAAVFVVSAVAKDNILLTIACAVGLALAIHLVLLLTMVIVRVYKMTSRKLLDVRTGTTASVTKLPTRRRANGS